MLNQFLSTSEDRIVFDQIGRVRLDCTVLRAHAFKAFAIIVPDESTAPGSALSPHGEVLHHKLAFRHSIRVSLIILNGNIRDGPQNSQPDADVGKAHNITATYNSSANFDSSSASLTQPVNQEARSR